MLRRPSAITAHLKSHQIHMSGNATYQELNKLVQ
jgi:hypothetical protein